MQKITVLCVGKLKEAFYEQAVKEYEKRLSRCCKLELLELPEQRLGDEPSEAEIRDALRYNLCRCGAYPHIVDAIKQAAAEMAKESA